MPWVKLDDQFFFNHKVLQAGRDARDLYLAGLAYSAGQLTNGFIPDGTLSLIAVMAGVDDVEECTHRLLDVGLWELRKPGGFCIHDYHDYNPTKDEVLVLREQRASAGRRGGLASAEAKAQASAEANRQAKEKQNSTPSPSPSPVPVPVPVPAEEIPAAEAAPAPPKPKKPESSPAVKAHWRILRCRLKDAVKAEIDKHVTNESNLAQWEQALDAWALRGFNPKNVQGQLDWLRDGIPNSGPRVSSTPMTRQERSLEVAKRRIAKENAKEAAGGN